MSQAEVFVLQDDVPRSAMRELAASLGWPRTGQTDRGHLVMASERWSPAEGITATWVENHTSDVRSVHVEGDGEAFEAAVTPLRAALGHDDAATLIAAVDTATEPSALIRLAGKLATCRPLECNEDHLQALRVLLGHPEVAVRRAAVRTAYNYPWSELAPVIETQLADDAALATQLKHLLQRLQAP